MTTDLSRKVILHYSLRESLLNDIISQTNMMLFGQIVSLLLLYTQNIYAHVAIALAAQATGWGNPANGFQGAYPAYR